MKKSNVQSPTSNVDVTGLRYQKMRTLDFGLSQICETSKNSDIGPWTLDFGLSHTVQPLLRYSHRNSLSFLKAFY
jgi:hypothetical protein